MEKYYQAAILLIIGGLVTALIARRKGGNFLKWWLYGTFILPVALVHALSLRLDEMGGSKSCGYCRMKVKMAAANCPRCGYEFIDFR